MIFRDPSPKRLLLPILMFAPHLMCTETWADDIAAVEERLQRIDQLSAQLRYIGDFFKTDSGEMYTLVHGKKIQRKISYLQEVCGVQVRGTQGPPVVTFRDFSPSGTTAFHANHGGRPVHLMKAWILYKKVA